MRAEPASSQIVPRTAFPLPLSCRCRKSRAWRTRRDRLAAARFTHCSWTLCIV